jgi:hypothetical protein
MLINISKVIGGTVRVTKKKEYVIWVVDNKKLIINILDIFRIYPPLTSRLICQLTFLKTCMADNSVDTYLKNRNNKYINQLDIINNYINNCFSIPSYFSS